MPLATNPFHVRTSEQASSDTRFLGLFGPGVLQGLSPGELWDRLIVFRSAPGGGKTSILRLFTPGALRALHQNRHQEATKRLADVLVEWGVLGDQGPTLLGTRLSCDQQYAAIREMTDDDARRRQLFFALVNARVVLATLRGAVGLAGGAWPTDVARVRIVADADAELPAGAVHAFPERDGQSLYERACAIERDICARLNELGGGGVLNAPAHADIWALYVLGGHIWYDDQLIAERVLVAFDDVQMLHRTQRDDLRRALMNRDVRVARWIAERWQGLSLEETFGQGATLGRDYQIVQLDSWADDVNQRLSRFERTVGDIANRRTQASDVMQEQALTTAAFEAFLQDIGDAPPTAAWLERTIAAARTRVEALSGNAPRYRSWIEDHVRPSERTVDALRAWRELEILVERDQARRQGDLFPNEALTSVEFDARFSSSVAVAAELFVAREYGTPYYYGMRRLAQLASWNIEQFLDLAGDMFDLVSMAVTLKKPAKITPRQQHDMVRGTAKAMLDAIPRRIPHGEAVRALIEHAGRMAEKETYRPSAPYAPGVNGFAVSMSDLQVLKDSRALRQDPAAHQLMQVLTAAVWNNLLQVQLDYPCKNRLWAVFYLNRLLCAHYHLPLHYGGFREKKLSEVKRWITPVEDNAIELALHA